LQELILIEDAAKRLNVEKITLIRAIHAGELEAFAIGRGYQTTEEALQKYVESKKVGGTKDVLSR
jgi:excisionase family DNA binding protein